MLERGARLSGSLLLAMLVVSLPPISGVGDAWAQSAGGGEATLIVPAVSTSGEGVLGRLTIRVEGGSGRVYFSADPLTQLDTQSAARTAALVACSLLGVDPSKYDFYVSMESDSMVVGGPSAGAAMAVGMVAALANLSLRSDVIVTGMVNPDGTIGPVGGIPDKLRAAAAGGARLFLIPAGQEVVIESKVVEERGPFWVTRRLVSERVNVTQLGRELGVEVREVMTVREALEIFTGWRIEREAAGDVSLPENVRSEIASWIDSYMESYRSASAEAKSLLAGIPSRSLGEYVSQALSLADREARGSEDLLAEGRVYSAVSSAFRAAIEADRARLVARMATADSPEEELLSYASEANGSLSSAEAALSSLEPNSLTELEVLVGAWERLYDAKQAMAQAESSYKEGNLISAAEWLCYANWRAKTAENWASLRVSGGPPPSRAGVYRVASTMVYEADSVVGYAATLLEEIGAQSGFLDRALSSLSMAKMAEDDGRAYAALGLAAEAISYATLSIHGAFATADPGSLAGAVSEESRWLISRVMKTGAVPVLALSYLEHAEVSESQGDLTTALLFYELAATYANLDSLMAELKPPLEGPPLVSPAPTEAPPSQGPTKRPQPAEFDRAGLVAMGLLGFFAGAAVTLAITRSRRGL